MPRLTTILLAGALCVPAATPAHAQDANFVRPVAEIEQHLRSHSFRVLAWTGSRMPDDRTQRVTLEFEDSSVVLAKWANAPLGGSDFNNEPRYEAAAYEIQKLFLDPDEYVVPPTVLRAFPLDYVRAEMPRVQPTFSEASSVLVALQYWLSQVTASGFWDARRADADTVYARHIANFNILTYLIRHNDSNVGNFLISQYEPNPRVFAVDNGVAFRSVVSNRGFEWRELRVRRVPAHTVERLRALDLEALERALGVIAEFEVRDGELVAVGPGENLNRSQGVRRRQGRVQFGLTAGEIRDIDTRRRNLLRMVERGSIQTF